MMYSNQNKRFCFGEVCCRSFERWTWWRTPTWTKCIFHFFSSCVHARQYRLGIDANFWHNFLDRYHFKVRGIFVLSMTRLFLWLSVACHWEEALSPKWLSFFINTLFDIIDDLRRWDFNPLSYTSTTNFVSRPDARQWVTPSPWWRLRNPINSDIK